MDTPYFCLISFLLFFAVSCFWGLCSLGFFWEVLELLPVDSGYSLYDFIECPFVFGFSLSVSFSSFLCLIFSIADLRKSSAEADKNKNENKE